MWIQDTDTLAHDQAVGVFCLQQPGGGLHPQVSLDRRLRIRREEQNSCCHPYQGGVCPVGAVQGGITVFVGGDQEGPLACTQQPEAAARLRSAPGGLADEA